MVGNNTNIPPGNPSEPGQDPPGERPDPCWKCKWIDGTYTFSTECPRPSKPTGDFEGGGDPNKWTVKAEVWYNEECRCRGLEPGILGRRYHLTCGCGTRDQVWGDPMGAGAGDDYMAKFCMTLQPDRNEEDCFSVPAPLPIDGMLENCADKFRIKLCDVETSIKHRCSGPFPPAVGGTLFPPPAQVARKAAQAVRDDILFGRCAKRLEQLLNQKNCDCDKTVVTGPPGG